MTLDELNHMYGLLYIPSDEEPIDPIYRMNELTGVYEHFFDYERTTHPTKPGVIIKRYLKYRDEVIVEDLLNSNTTVRDSISIEHIKEIQANYISNNGEISLPDDFDEEYYKSYAESAQYLDFADSGFYREEYPYEDVTAEDFNINIRNASLLIGRWSNGLNRKLTAEDLNLSNELIYKLIGTYSPVLKRDFTAEDLDFEDIFPLKLRSSRIYGHEANQASSNNNVEEQSDLIGTDLNVNDTTTEEKLLDFNVENNMSLHDDIPSGMRKWHSSWNLANQTSSNLNVEEQSDLIVTDLNVNDTTTEETVIDFNVENNLSKNMSFFTNLPDLNTLLATATPAVLGCVVNGLLGSIKYNKNLKNEKLLTLHSAIMEQIKTRKYNERTSPQD
jgi:hypothetical protein